MSGITRIYVEKKPGFDIEAQNLKSDLRFTLGLNGLKDVRIFKRYDVRGLEGEDLERARRIVFSEPNCDTVSDALPELRGAFAVEYLPGQYDQRADSAAQCVQLLTQGDRPQVRTATVYAFEGVAADEIERIKHYIINPVESREASMDIPDTLDMPVTAPEAVKRVDGFISMPFNDVEAMVKRLGFAMSAEDLAFCQMYFAKTERRDPTMTELRAIDTYWSDHCRHTTFLSAIDGVEIDTGLLSTPIAEAYGEYMRTRVFVDDKRDVSLMDLAIIGMKALKRDGRLNDLDESDEINACSIVVEADVDGHTEPWLVMFKNETHNHPTEIEPFGGAATCLGGAIRDPLSGRSYVYQCMRITGAGDPRTPFADTLEGKLPQRKICLTAAGGYSSYGNQIGLAAGKVQEIYHPGYVAKRMELGAVIAAAPQKNVRREQPQPGDAVILVGGRTGRDGCGGATGSSKAHTHESLSTCGAEVQKGNPPTERAMQRLFRNPKFAHMIKRCNDFGAGGVSVAIGELSDGLDINLDAVPRKYEGLDGTELAISESQERMACVIEPKDVEHFIEMARAENLEATFVATVTDKNRLCMTWRGQTVVDLSRDFLNTNGVTQHVRAHITAPDADKNYFNRAPRAIHNCRTLPEAWVHNLQDLNVCSQKGLVERFDSTIGAETLLAPYGGKYRLTPNEAMAAKLPVMGHTNTATLMSHGYDPYLSTWSPFHGALYAVVESASKIAAAGGDVRTIRLTFQEFFERLNKDPEKWGRPLASLLGALTAQLRLGIPSIGGKDSMSGTFEDISVPPTLISIAVNVLDARTVISDELKGAGHKLYALMVPRDKYMMPRWNELLKMYDGLHCLALDGKILSAHTIGQGGIAAAVSLMAFGNRIGVKVNPDWDTYSLFLPEYGSIIIEVDDTFNPDELPACSHPLGDTTHDNFIAVGDKRIMLDDAIAAWQVPLSEVFPENDGRKPLKVGYEKYTERSAHRPAVKIAKPRVLIPVFPGTNCEYDTQRAFERAGAKVDVALIRNLSQADVEQSVSELIKLINSANIIALPGGFSGGDEPDGSAKFIAATLRNPAIADAIMEMLKNRDGLMLGICNGFQALIKLGLVPYGEIRPELNEDDATLTFNTLGRHASAIINTVVTSVKSPWFNYVNIGDVHTIAISHGEGRFVASDEMVQQLLKNGQVATQYCTPDGVPAATTPENPNGSVWAIEGITSPDGRILGKMGHSERSIDDQVLKNVPGVKDQQLFRAGVDYFA